MEDFEGSLRRADLAADPVEQFASWFTEAQEAVTLPEAIALATADAEGKPAVRFVLLKAFGPEGFDFYTDYRSDKARQMESNPHAALAIWWQELGRQVRVSGPVARLEERESDLYFASRPREAQLGAWASQQSSPLEDRAELEDGVGEAASRFEGRDVDRPPHWGGFRIVAERVEFWQQGNSRLHDRFRYSRGESGDWTLERLSP